MRSDVPISVEQIGRVFTRWDVLAILLTISLLVFLAETSRHLLQPLAELRQVPVSLDPHFLPEYAARTTLRMLVALVLSLVFTFTYATAAAKSRRAEMLLIPLLDILQSVPILGFISVTVIFFMSLAPGRVLGAEFAAIFAIFTSQAWNMAFSFYQSLRTVPIELVEASRTFRLSPWMHFWRVEVPFAMPQLIWNTMVSMSGSWFFVVASEAISVGNTTVTLPGIGAYLSLAIDQKDLVAVGWAIGAMLVVILLYDQLLFRPLVAWADRFRFEQQSGVTPPQSLVLDVFRRSGIVATLVAPLSRLWQRTYRLSVIKSSKVIEPSAERLQWGDRIWTGFVFALAAIALWRIVEFVAVNISLREMAKAGVYGLATLTRVVVLITLASVIWVPIGVMVGTRPRIAQLVQPLVQFFAAFPANVLFPVVVVAMHMEVDDLFPIAETLQLMRFAEVEGGDIRLTDAGKEFAAADVDARKKLFQRQLLTYVPLAAHIRRVLQERANHTAPRTRFRNELEDHMTTESATRTLGAVIAWARFAEAFAYDARSETFSLDNPT
jgi:NitT/TauT family transport system permease protein